MARMRRLLILTRGRARFRGRMKGGFLHGGAEGRVAGPRREVGARRRNQPPWPSRRPSPGASVRRRSTSRPSRAARLSADRRGLGQAGGQLRSAAASSGARARAGPDWLRRGSPSGPARSAAAPPRRRPGRGSAGRGVAAPGAASGRRPGRRPSAPASRRRRARTDQLHRLGAARPAPRRRSPASGPSGLGAAGRTARPAP